MEQNARPISPLMRKLQGALEQDLQSPQTQPAIPSPAPPMQRLPSTPKPAPLMPPEKPVLPSFTSEAITKGDYIHPAIDPQIDPELAAEDLTEKELKSNSRSRYAGIILATAIILAGSAGLAAFMIFLSPPKEAAGPVPEIRAEPSLVKTAPDAAPPLRAEEPPATLAATPVPSAPVSMGDVSSELVPPTTDGLSPARRIGTTRILLDGDKEIRP